MTSYTDMIFFGVGFGGSMAWNSSSGVPIHRGNPRNVAVGLICGVAGHLIQMKRDEMARIKLFELEEFVRSNPVDFPPVERKKWGDVFQTWTSPFRPDTD